MWTQLGLGAETRAITILHTRGLFLMWRIQPCGRDLAIFYPISEPAAALQKESFLSSRRRDVSRMNLVIRTFMLSSTTLVNTTHSLQKGRLRMFDDNLSTWHKHLYDAFNWCPMMKYKFLKLSTFLDYYHRWYQWLSCGQMVCQHLRGSFAARNCQQVMHYLLIVSQQEHLLSSNADDINICKWASKQIWMKHYLSFRATSLC